MSPRTASSAAAAARIAPATPPYSEETQAAFDRIMRPGLAPLVLFTTLARDERLYARFRNGGLLDRGHLTLRQREIVIDRVTAQNRCEYEWGVHVALFAERVGIDATMQASLVHGGPDDPCWSEEDRVLIRACDQLHAGATLDDQAWDALTGIVGEMGAMGVLMLAGFYRTVSYLANAINLPLEDFAARFPPAVSEASGAETAPGRSK